jgi:hypothetical protein
MSNKNEISLSKDELIKKLQKISKLCDNVLEIKSEIDNFEPQDDYPRNFAVPVFPGEYANEDEREELESAVDHTDTDAIEQMSNAYDDMYHPKKPSEPRKPEFKGANTGKSKEKQNKLRLISNIGLGVAIFFLVGALVGTSDTPEALPAILIIACIGAIAFVGGKYLGKKEKEVEDRLEAVAKAEYDKEISIINEEHKKALKVYEDERSAYVAVRQAFLKDYASWREAYLKSLAEEDKIQEQLEADRQAEVDKIIKQKLNPAVRELEEENDLLSNDYLGAIDVIIDLLKSNRADTLKEAINVYEEIVYRERQLQLQREQEAQRRYEEELRRQEEERRYQEEKRFREDQERQRRYEEEQRRRDEETRYREETRAREAEALRRENQERERIRREEYNAHMNRIEQERKQRNAAQAQCRACINVGHCNMSIHNDTPNCAGFRPRR